MIIDTPTYTVIIPVFNEEDNIEGMISDLQEHLKLKNLSCNIILVNDGSSDQSKEIITRISKEQNQSFNIKAIHLEKNSGIGFCYKRALKEVNTPFVTWIPSDGEIPAEPLVEAMTAASQDKLVISYPTFNRNPRTKTRHLLSKCYTSILNKTFKLKLTYFNGFTVFPTKALKKIHLRSDRFAFNAEALIKVLKQTNLDYLEHPFQLTARNSGKSKALSLASLTDIVSFYFFTVVEVYRAKGRD